MRSFVIIVVREMPSSRDPGWITVDGGGVRIAVAPSGSPWITANDQTIWQRFNGLTGPWHQLPGSAFDIGLGADGMPWVIGTNRTAGGWGIYWWDGLNWVSVPGGATTISVGVSSKPWVVNNANQVYQAM
jgi:hypothetical protein